MQRRTDATVLVVDDEPGVADAYTACLESADYDVRTARNGGEALAEVGPEVDVVLLDRRMPGMSGDEVLEHVCEWHPDCRVAMVTAVDPGPDILELSFDDYVTKPVERDRLLAVVDRLLLFDRYEALLEEYYATVRTRAVLTAHERRTARNHVDPADLEDRLSSLRAEIEAVLDSFDDDAIREVVRSVSPVPG